MDVLVATASVLTYLLGFRLGLEGALIILFEPGKASFASYFDVKRPLGGFEDSFGPSERDLAVLRQVAGQTLARCRLRFRSLKHEKISELVSA